MLGIPVASLEPVSGSNKADTVAKRNRILGNGFHIPSICIVLFLLIEAARAAVPPVYPPCHQQCADFTERVQGSIFEPDRLMS